MTWWWSQESKNEPFYKHAQHALLFAQLKQLYQCYVQYVQQPSRTQCMQLQVREQLNFYHVTSMTCAMSFILYSPYAIK